MHFDEGSLYIKNSNFIDNHGKNRGNCIYTDKTKVTLEKVEAKST